MTTKKTLTELYEELMSYVWRIRLVNNEHEVTYYVNAFSVEEGVIIASALNFFYQEKFIHYTITGRRLDEKEFSRRLKVVFHQSRLGLVMLEEEEPPLPPIIKNFGKLESAKQNLHYGEEIHACTSYGYGTPIECLIVGKVGFPSRDSTDFDVNDKLCRDHMPSDERKLGKADYRVMGDIINNKSLLAEEGDMRGLAVGFLRSLVSSIPIIQCNRFPLDIEGVGAPIVDCDGRIAGMLIGVIGKYVVAIQPGVIKRFIEEAKPTKPKRKFESI